MLVNSWITKEFVGAVLPDQRFKANLYKICESMWSGLSLSFSASLGSKLRQSAHRLFSYTKRIDLLKGHHEETAKRAQGEAMLLLAEDTTDINFDSHPATTGLGNTGGPFDTQGLCMHSVMAFTVAGVPLGILSCKIWSPVVYRARANKVRLHKIPLEQKESYRWIESYSQIKSYLEGYSGTILKITDREGDFYEHFSNKPEKVEVLIRAKCLSRLVVSTGGVRKRLDKAVSEFPVLGSNVLHVEKRKGQSARDALLEFRAGPVDLLPTYKRKGDTIPVWLVCAEERDAPEGVEPLKWYLYTTLQPKGSADEDLLRFSKDCVAYYKSRWAVERFHFTIKQGCRIEDLQMDTATRLSNAIRVYCIIAWYILRLEYFARANPDTDILEVGTQEDKDIIEKVTARKVKTVKDFTLALASLVGFVPSRKQPMPGERVMWTSVSIFIKIKSGYLLGQEDRSPPKVTIQE